LFATGGGFTPGARAYLTQVETSRLEKPLSAVILQKKRVLAWVAAGKRDVG
jgi:hypothetical protein